MLGEEHPDISVTILPTEFALDRILTLPGLKSLTIRVNAPNADTSSPAARQRVLAKLEAAKAKQLEEKWTKSGQAEAILPTPEIRELASVAADTGYVRAEGRGADGKTTMAATDDFPRRYYVRQSSGDTFVQRLVNTLGRML